MAVVKQFEELPENLTYPAITPVLFDYLIQLCDSIAKADGIVSLKERMNDVKSRYGFYPEEKWDRNIELKQYFENKTGKNLYEM